jgi:hypothetical protein
MTRVRPTVYRKFPIEVRNNNKETQVLFVKKYKLAVELDNYESGFGHNYSMLRDAPLFVERMSVNGGGKQSRLW